MFLIGAILILAPLFWKNITSYMVSGVGLSIASLWASPDINPFIFLSGLVMFIVSIYLNTKETGDKAIPLSVVGMSLMLIHSIAGLGFMGIIIVIALHVALNRYLSKN